MKGCVIKASIAVDIDGVLNDQLGFFDRIADRYGITDRSYQNSYNGIYKCYDQDNVLLADRIFKDHLEEFLLDSKPIDGARQTFKKFVEHDKLNTYIVTARNSENKDLTMQWLKLNAFVGQQDTLFLKDKLESNCSILIDDHCKHIERFASNARMGIIQNRPYNQDCNVGYRVDTLKEAFEHLTQFL